MLAILILNAAPGNAVEKREIDAVRAFMTQGETHRAINQSRRLLGDSSLNDEQRFELLLLLAESEEQLTSLRGYKDAEVSIRAYQDLHKEYPERFGAAKMHWKVAWLSWKQQKYDQADSALQAIIQDYPHSAEAKRAALLHARYLIKRSKFQAAREILLRYFGLGTDITDFEETEGLIWLAIIDDADGNHKQAFRSLSDSYGRHPEIIEADPYLYAAYIHLLSLFEERSVQTLHIKRFLKRYASTPEALPVRLQQADILVEDGDLKGAETIYGILASRHIESAVGKQAYLRHLMLRNRKVEDKEKLMAALDKLQRMVAGNQLSDIETEAMLYQARIMARLSEFDVEYQAKATTSYAIAASFERPVRFVEAAEREGKALLRRHIQELLKQEKWLQAAVLWKRYPQIRPKDSRKLAFGVAQAYMRLLDYVHAEEMLDRLYVEAGNSVWSQRIMLEKARLWAERNDTDAVIKIMQWLAKHEKTLYRQDLLLIVAAIENNQGAASAASQTLANINPGDLTPELRRTYWQTKAGINLNLKRWHAAAGAWKELADAAEGDEKWHYLSEQADALIQSRDFGDAETVLLKIPEANRKDAWHYAIALCAINTGRWKKGREHLLIISGPDADPDYRMRARMLLAQEEADQMKRKHQ